MGARAVERFRSNNADLQIQRIEYDSFRRFVVSRQTPIHALFIERFREQARARLRAERRVWPGRD